MGKRIKCGRVLLSEQELSHHLSSPDIQVVRKVSLLFSIANSQYRPIAMLLNLDYTSNSFSLSKFWPSLSVSVVSVKSEYRITNLKFIA